MNQADIVMKELLKPDETDTMTTQILQALFWCTLTLLERQAGDHIPRGKYFTKPEDVYIESASVLNET